MTRRSAPSDRRSRAGTHAAGDPGVQVRPLVVQPLREVVGGLTLQTFGFRTFASVGTATAADLQRLAHLAQRIDPSASSDPVGSVGDGRVRPLDGRPPRRPPSDRRSGGRLASRVAERFERSGHSVCLPAVHVRIPGRGVRGWVGNEGEILVSTKILSPARRRPVARAMRRPQPAVPVVSVVQVERLVRPYRLGAAAAQHAAGLYLARPLAPDPAVFGVVATLAGAAAGAFVLAPMLDALAGLDELAASRLAAHPQGSRHTPEGMNLPSGFQHCPAVALHGAGREHSPG